MPKTAVVPRPRICQASSKTCAACCALLPTPARLTGITSRWDVVVVIVSTVRAAAMLRNHNVRHDEDEEGSRRLGDS